MVILLAGASKRGAGYRNGLVFVGTLLAVVGVTSASVTVGVAVETRVAVGVGVKAGTGVAEGSVAGKAVELGETVAVGNLTWIGSAVSGTDVGVCTAN